MASFHTVSKCEILHVMHYAVVLHSKIMAQAESQCDSQWNLLPKREKGAADSTFKGMHPTKLHPKESPEHADVHIFGKRMSHPAEGKEGNHWVL